MQQETNFSSVYNEQSLRLFKVQGHNWDDVEATALQVGKDAFPSGAKLTLYPKGDLKRCADETDHSHHFGEDPKKYFLSELIVKASWNEERPETKTMVQAHCLNLRVIWGDNWESIKKAALREGAEAFPSAEVFTVGFKNGRDLRRCADWTRSHDFGEDPKGFFIEGLIVRSWRAVDK